MDNNEVLVNNDEISDFGNVRIANYTETSNTTSNNNKDPLDYGTISQCNRVAYIIDIVCKIGFLSLTIVFIAQLYTFLGLKPNWLHIIRSIMYKTELKKT